MVHRNARIRERYVVLCCRLVSARRFAVAEEERTYGVIVLEGARRNALATHKRCSSVSGRGRPRAADARRHASHSGEPRRINTPAVTRPARPILALQ